MMMKTRIFGLSAMAALVLALLGVCGCEAMKQQMNADGTEGPYEPRYVLSCHDFIQYPRGMSNLERKARAFDGTEVYYNANQFLSSEHIEEARAIPVANKPEMRRILLKLNRRGRLNWQMAYQHAKTKRMLVLLDGGLVGDFIPVTASSPDQEWFELDCEFDSVIADGIVKYAPKNFEYYNPDQKKSWF